MAEAKLNDLLAEVSTALQRVEKKGKAPAAMGGFDFVRESDVVELLKGELDKRGITLVPQVTDLRLDFYTRSGKDNPGVLATVTLEMHAVHKEESRLLFRTVGQGADTQDKAPAKAITAAKKQGLLIAFSIPTGDDPEAEHLADEGGSRQARRTSASSGNTKPAATEDVADPTTTPASRKQQDELKSLAAENGLTKDEMSVLRQAHTDKAKSSEFTVADYEAMKKAIVETGKVKAAAGAGSEVIQ